ncbi:hypothetical protein LWI28_011490 [Acer negundo]|uniref:mannosyl-glycoprotein endo-beta-N-acetylglucosaminidase n=1 Tax=Acer negundo TaxID=4023 RepID=A0AAD5I9V0_ACENE|nr:hypothetical protein LWI28_011490 [Acer negundo]KAK4836373.1 hypothetical protein QYF36_022148 [Acer negundo]
MLNISHLLRNYINRQILVTIRNFLNTIHQKSHSLFLFITRSESPSNGHQSSSLDPPPPPFDSSEPSVPISYPIKSLQDLESLVYFDSFHYPFNRSSVPLQNAGFPDRPRILVCHDMTGGYVDDKWVQGGTNADVYAIWHWYLIDVFVYFSHNLVTLPPPCWTNTAHKHGVKVLGTFVAEWDEGSVVADKLVSTKESAHMYAECLAELAVDLGFDGWLVNMEVGVSKGKSCNLKEFVSHLTNTMHSSLPGSLVIWYESVTIDGILRWQNQLNKKNKPFFDICDGIFVNYLWTEKYVKHSAAVAGNRKYDVYMGIDVFGRGTFGGGQWKTNVALDVLKKFDVSAAIFAPGWVYETDQPPDFQTAQNLWWSLVEKSWGISRNYPKVLPFYSNFDQGRGLHISAEGRQVLETPWNNLSSQGFQPFLNFSNDSNSDTIKVAVNFKEASYSGGGNITFKGTLRNGDHFIARLFRSKLLLEDFPIHITYSVKSEENSLIGLLLEVSSATKETKFVLVAASRGTNRFSGKFSEVIEPRQVKKQDMAPGWIVQETSIAMNGCTITGINALCYRPESKNRILRIQSECSQDSTLTCVPAEFFAVLGDITIKTSGQNSDFPPSSSWLVEAQYLKWTSNSQGSKILDVRISWKLKHGNVSLFPKYNIYVEAKQTNGSPERRLEVTRKYLGSAHMEAFFISDLDVPTGTDSLKFIVQVCSVDGTSQKLDGSPFLQLDVENK